MKQMTMIALGVGAYLLWKKNKAQVTTVLPPMAETDKIPLDYFENRGQAESEVEARLHAGQGSKSDYVLEPVTIQDKVFWHIIFSPVIASALVPAANKFNISPASIDPTSFAQVIQPAIEENLSLTRTFKDENGNLLTVY